MGNGTIAVTTADAEVFAAEAFRNIDVSDLSCDDVADIRVAMQTAFDRLATRAAPPAMDREAVALDWRLGVEIATHLAALDATARKPIAYAPKGHLERYLKGRDTACWVYGSPTAEDNDVLYCAAPDAAASDAGEGGFSLSHDDDPAFLAAWADMEAKGFAYGSEALESVHLGWLLAKGVLTATPASHASDGGKA